MTPAQQKALAFIRSYVAEHEYSPTFAEIGAHLGLVSKSGVHRLVHALEREGKIRFTHHAPRSIEPVGMKPAPVLQFDRGQLAKDLTEALLKAHPFVDNDGTKFIVGSVEEIRLTLLGVLMKRPPGATLGA